MRFEQIKSWILTGLVLLSVYLFWNLVTFQENYDNTIINNQEYINEISIEDKKELKDIFVPNKMIYRKGENQYVGSEKMELILPMMNVVRSWTYYDFQEIGSEFNDVWENNARDTAFILKFPDELPVELTKSLFSTDTKQFPPGTFHYMVIFPDQMKEDEGIVYLASANFSRAVKARVRNSNIDRFQDDLNNFIEESSPYYAYQKESGEYLFVLNEATSLGNYQYYPRDYNPEEFKNALFTDPSYVSKNGNRYTDGWSVLDIATDTKMLSFVDTTISIESPITINDLIQTSVGYINEHSGWTDRYYYADSNTTMHEITFQLYFDDYPVFNEIGLSEISLVIGNSGVYSYRRPYFILDYLSYNPVNKEYTLSSGKDVINYLSSIENLDIESVNDVMIGYHLNKEFNSQLIKLEPSWYYRVDNQWKQISEAEMGGVTGGLE
ncbi:two-component system activity regulator YycH [Caldibacillus lycopersici]|uniref:Two-component system activity regulator YycH n=1 Tax=Perspicuibacillus lycopersici TaxID=1325689 RepID=A0AAE3IRV0_9BACI|nr:two-component system activity regulator YycH [Perspicuibacillus lycopersici]MCU9613460.1 two-component system activity regulator YycH [Perspicuibacillus lycopersici]